jgi:hypothetical protein
LTGKFGLVGGGEIKLCGATELGLGVRRCRTPNRELKKLLAESALDAATLKEMAKKF